MFTVKPMAIAIFSIIVVQAAWADDTQTVELEAVEVKAKRQKIQSAPFSHGRKPSDKLIKGEVFKERSATLGNALSHETGIHTNPFGTGASAPIIRGQEGVRVKLLQNNLEIVDMSTLSPDHAVAADTLLAEQVEVVRGAPTLMYANASPAGVVNVTDKRIPTEVPEKGYEGEVALRQIPQAGDEKVATAGFTVGLGKHIAVRAEGLSRHAGNYDVPFLNVNKNTRLDYMPDTHNKSRVGTVGISLIGEKGHIGASYSYRRDRYGLPAHNHEHDNTKAHVIREGKQYLVFYPHLHDEKDLGPHYHNAPEAFTKPANEYEELGPKFDHTKPGPWVDMNTRRADLHGEWKEPLPSVAKISLRLSHTDYYHDEKDAGKDIDLNPYDSHGTADNYGRANNIFKNKGFGARVEVHHKPYHGFTGVWGAQWQRSKSSAYHSKILSGALKENWMLVENTNKQFSLFATGQWRWKDLTLELGARTEKQEIPIKYDREKLIIQRGCDPQTSWLCWRPEPTIYAPAPEIYSKRANSYAASLNWDFHPDYTLSLMYSHNERHPSPMELYYTGEHLATNSFEYGKKDLDKERSDNFEIGLRHVSDKWDYNLSTYYNRFQNYIYKQTIFQYGTLATYRYAQSQARFHGIEGSVSYRPNDKHQITLWGDYVRGKLVNLPDYIRYSIMGGVDEIHHKADRNAPRVPPARLGLRINSNWNEHWQTKIDYTRVFTQNKVSFFESFSNERPDVVERKTKGYHLLNLGVAYHNKIGSMQYRLYADANNVLNKKIYTHTSFLPYVPQIGRNFVFGVNMTF